MKIQKNYPEEFIGKTGRKYKLVQTYKFYGLYKTETGYNVCFDLEGIRRETEYKREVMGR